MTARLCSCVLLLLVAMPVSAQTVPTIPVLGVGQVAFDIDAPDLATAMRQVYRGYLGTNAPIILVVTCTGAAPTFTCAFPLNSLPLTILAQPLSLTVAAVAEDGELEGAKVAAPFALVKAPGPVGIRLPRVRPSP